MRDSPIQQYKRRKNGADVFAPFALFCGNCLGWEFFAARDEFAFQQCKPSPRRSSDLRACTAGSTKFFPL